MHIVKPAVDLIPGIVVPGELLQKIYQGYRRCYSDKTDAEFLETPTVEEMEKFIRRMRKTPHLSPLEHVSLTFHISNVSRAMTHQLVRHRIASYSQQSQRYVQMDDLPVVMPSFDYINDEKTKDILKEIITKTAEYTENSYKDLTAFEVKPEDARAVLPNFVATQIVVTMNLRSLLHFFEERMCYRAQEEIRIVADMMYEICKDLLPCVFENAGPKCMVMGRCPEHTPCNKKPYKRGTDGNNGGTGCSV